MKMVGVRIEGVGGFKRRCFLSFTLTEQLFPQKPFTAVECGTTNLTVAISTSPSLLPTSTSTPHRARN